MEDVYFRCLPAGPDPLEMQVLSTGDDLAMRKLLVEQAQARGWDAVLIEKWRCLPSRDYPYQLLQRVNHEWISLREGR